MTRIRDSLKTKRILVSDGAWGTFLVGKGLQTGECPERWNVDRPEEVLDVARSYIAAGSDIISTNSFGGSPIKLSAYGLAERTAELNEAAAAISRKAAGPHAHVMASLGPSGKLLLMGGVTEEELCEGFAQQARAFERGGADACCIETMTALDEACLAIRAVKENTRLEVICSFTFDKSADGSYHTMMGITPRTMAEGVLTAGADIIGANCGQGSERMIEIVAELRSAAPHAPILVQPNAGMPVLRDGTETYPETPEDMAALVRELIAAGANIVGGCCGTGPRHIEAIAAAARAAFAKPIEKECL